MFRRLVYNEWKVKGHLWEQSNGKMVLWDKLFQSLPMIWIKYLNKIKRRFNESTNGQRDEMTKEQATHSWPLKVPVFKSVQALLINTNCI